MPGKRKGDSLTGGTGDVNPQTLTSPILSQSGVDSIDQFQLPVPIPRYPQQNGMQIVMEILKVNFYFTSVQLALSQLNRFLITLTTNPNKPPSVEAAIQDPRSISQYSLGVVTAAAAGQSVIPLDFTEDLTDNAGHGLLIATDNIYFVLATQATGLSSARGLCKITYRFKQVTLAEYIGIVQSQQ